MSLTASVATLSHTGRVRRRNEDAVGADLRRGVLVVADGMGGHPAGHIASRLAVEEVLEYLAEGSDPDSGEASHLAAGDRMAEAVHSADERVRTEAARNPEHAGMGTTLTVFLLDAEQNRWRIGHVGDSRAYLFRGGTLTRLTRDDTWVQTQLDAGRLTEELARIHPWASVLSQALGVDGPVIPALLEGQAYPGDVFLLCSDGLVAHLADHELTAVLRAHLSEGIDIVANLLVQRANTAGGTDNITVGLLRVDRAEEDQLIRPAG